ncbi:MAG: hypothetical protein A3C15_03020 [Candidatus Magasanikbacteria bacterium RIFCSPHIGHO2_02_FULL_50_9b]|uniref:Uncharacterized protein n=1 Tax=Candidatus Magasanikbacteria bacterium RIFCSPHIGHO2_02_FULL_50_9b TaxID=1798682 RepID=A0A1F6M900_9BACT|nr:MAG: hypothetical protein A3C15_03020 [Candidatus Magasanikbacteria bacterium RIFCSPHIGHO2_02_FULL_50_9b]
MNKFHVIGLANTFAIIDIVLHPLFHLWVRVSPGSYVWLMNLFVVGLHVEVTAFDTSVFHIILGTIIEASVFWLLGATVAFLYNRLSQNRV